MPEDEDRIINGMGRTVIFGADDWYELGIQAAIERKHGRGPIIRKAVHQYLAETKAQREGMGGSTPE